MERKELEQRGWRFAFSDPVHDFFTHAGLPLMEQWKAGMVEKWKDAALETARKRCADIAVAMAQKSEGEAETAARCIANAILATP